ncbi:MAG: nucleotide pyrophosphohydrolase [Epsilonproteobacteria bacterium]|nr:nucleotide pyrophosphohydrolase [Campylobacterota bacterium]NPA56600.1 nucleotide pyrophosphohydrolase [Campylobacterota bacterium]
MEECRDLGELQELLDNFIAERGWEGYHRPKNLAMSVAIEAAELMEHFQWCDRDPEEFTPEERREIGEEMADVLHYLLRLASVLDIDLYRASKRKIEKNRERFPVHSAGEVRKDGC